jgi:hypothetical protein
MFGEQEHALDIDLHDAAVAFRLFRDYAAATADADIVIEKVEPTEAIDACRHQRRAIALIGDVAARGERGAALRRDHVDGVLRQCQFAICNHSFGASPREQDGGRPAVAVTGRAATADQRDLAGEASLLLNSPHVIFLLFSAR